MDTNRPYTGDHAPLVKLNGAEARGIQQTGLAVRKGKSYTGRVVLAGDPGAKVTISLVWGTNANERQTVAVGKLRAEYAKVPAEASRRRRTATMRGWRLSEPARALFTSALFR